MLLRFCYCTRCGGCDLAVRDRVDAVLLSATVRVLIFLTRSYRGTVPSPQQRGCMEEPAVEWTDGRCHNYSRARSLIRWFSNTYHVYTRIIRVLCVARKLSLYKMIHCVYVHIYTECLAWFDFENTFNFDFVLFDICICYKIHIKILRNIFYINLFLPEIKKKKKNYKFRK